MDQAQAHAGGWTRVSFFISRMWGATFSPRTANLPRVASDLDTIRADRGAVTVTWVGHATLLIQLDGVNILTDPHWSDRASPVSFAGPRRVSAPGMRFEDLPPIHIVVISHDHYDHLDVATVKRLSASATLSGPARPQGVVRGYRDHRCRGARLVGPA
jgi:L-ascorbate metabolism protein UlaG (beta-lactamase superfamily)